MKRIMTLLAVSAVLILLAGGALLRVSGTETNGDSPAKVGRDGNAPTALAKDEPVSLVRDSGRSPELRKSEAKGHLFALADKFEVKARAGIRTMQAARTETDALASLNAFRHAMLTQKYHIQEMLRLYPEMLHQSEPPEDAREPVETIRKLTKSYYLTVKDLRKRFQKNPRVAMRYREIMKEAALSIADH